MNVIPATVISGFAGAGKSLLKEQLRQALSDKKLLTMVSHLGAGEVDAGLCESNTPDRSIKCESREHLCLELRKMGRAREWEHLLVDCTQVSEPLPVAECFALDDGRGTPVSRYTKIDALITVVDAPTFFDDIASPDSLRERNQDVRLRDERRVAEVLVAQVELSNILVIAGSRSVSETALSRLTGLLGCLNPDARIVRLDDPGFDPKSLLETSLFNFDLNTTATSPTRYCDAAPPAPQSGYSIMGYRRFRPFHPERFEEFVHGDVLRGVVRSKGVFWVANRPNVSGEWSQAGKSRHHAFAGSFWAATPEADWPLGPEQRARVKANWKEPFGDRRQELSFVMEDITPAELEQRLDACLLTDRDLANGLAVWEEASHEPAPHVDHEHSGHLDAGDGSAHHHGEAFVGHSPHGSKRLQ
ncbi:MAG: GTP-binding protein [Polyangiaceae bacterium]|nr:GTP-binding protein [Polyangiaceae bacterium]